MPDAAPQDAEGRAPLTRSELHEIEGHIMDALTPPIGLDPRRETFLQTLLAKVQQRMRLATADPEGEPCERCGDKGEIRKVVTKQPGMGKYLVPCPDCGTPDESEGRVGRIDVEERVLVDVIEEEIKEQHFWVEANPIIEQEARDVALSVLGRLRKAAQPDESEGPEETAYGFVERKLREALRRQVDEMARPDEETEGGVRRRANAGPNPAKQDPIRSSPSPSSGEEWGAPAPSRVREMQGEVLSEERLDWVWDELEMEYGPWDDAPTDHSVLTTFRALREKLAGAEQKSLVNWRAAIDYLRERDEARAENQRLKGLLEEASEQLWDTAAPDQLELRARIREALEEFHG